MAKVIREWAWKGPKGERKMVLEVKNGVPRLVLVTPRRQHVGGPGTKVKSIPAAARKRLGVPADWAFLDTSRLVAPRAILEEAIAEVNRILREQREARERRARERENAIRQAWERLPDEAKRLLKEAERLGREAGEWARDPDGDWVALSIAARAGQLRRKAQALCPHEVMDERRGPVSYTYAEVEPGRFAEVKRVKVSRTCAVCGYTEERTEESVVREVSRDEYLNWLMR